jgi:hypothetical protein
VDTATGNVGIGLASPTAHLHVYNNDTSGVQLRIENANQSGRTGLGIFNAAGQRFNIQHVGGATATSNAAIIENYSTVNGGIQFYNKGDGDYLFMTTDSNTERMRISNGGNVGIGTASPNAKLQVHYTEGTLANFSYNTPSSYYNKGLALNGGSGGFLYGVDINHSIFLRQSPFGTNDHNAYCNYGYHAFYTGGLIENQTEKMRITSDGSVGIGTVSPSFKLHVWAGDSDTAIIGASGSNQGTGVVYVGQSASYGGGIAYNGDGSPDWDGSGSDYISLFRRNNNTNAWTARNYYDNNDWQFRGSVISDGALYVGEWLRINSTGTTGIYWHNPSSTGYAWHIYPKDRNDMYFRTGLTNGGIAGTCGDQTVRGYIHWTVANEIGFLNSGRTWSLRCDNSLNCQIYGVASTGGLYSNGDSRLAAGSQMIYMGGNRTGYFMRFNDDAGFYDPQNGEIYTTNGAGNLWGQFRGYFYNVSSRDYKKEITRFTDDEILTLYNDTLATNLYSFYANADSPSDAKRRIGIILEESPDYLSPTKDGRGLCTTHWVTMLHGAIKIIDKNVKTVMNDMQSHLNFTGQHRTLISQVPLTQYENYEGMIVSADTDTYYNDNITINEALPIVSISKKIKDKSCFGVVSLKEDPNNYEYTAYIPREDGDIRIRVNSIGEGGIWVSNMNGNLESGDYITTSSIPGYGMKQDSEFLANYTVAKITMNCDFTKINIPQKRIKRELRDVTYYIQDIENVVEKDLYDRWDPRYRFVKEKECYAKTFVSTFNDAQDGGWIEYSNNNETTTIKQDEYDKLEESEKQKYKEVYKKVITRTITPLAWSQGKDDYKSQYTKTTSQFFVVVTHKETKTEPTDGYNYVTEIRSEMVNVLDEHGQIQWEDDTETALKYEIRYLLPDGTETTEENAVYIAAFVGCTYHCG